MTDHPVRPSSEQPGSPPAAAAGPAHPAAGPPARLTTFDCFDTVLTRAVGSPDTVAYAVAHAARRAGLLDHDVAVVAEARREAEQLVWVRERDTGTLADVWTQAVELLGLADDVAPRLASLELDVERRLLHPVPESVAEVEQARRDGAVGFLSDTPLSSDFVGEVLRGRGVMQDGDLLWVSNELGESKDRGGAFFAVARDLGGRPGHWEHVGDSRRSDVTMAERSGLVGRHRARATLTRYEKRLDTAAAATGGLGPVLAGASRLTRLRAGEQRPDIPAARVAVVAGVAGPLLSGYVLWVLRQAQRAGIRRLYFVARDGEVMLRLAQRLAPALGLDLDLRYLEGSRRAWLLPSGTGLDRDRLVAVMGREESITVRSCMSWVDLEPEDVSEVLARHGFTGDFDEQIDRAGMERLIGVLVGDLHEEVVRLAVTKTEATEAYMRGVGLLDDEPYALVDIGWQGTVGRLLTAVLEPLGGRPPAAEYYYGLTKPSHDAPGRDPRGYMFDEWRGLGGAQTLDIWVALEVFTAALPGRVESYALRDGEPVPVHGRPNLAAATWGLEGLHAVLDLYGDALAEHLDLVDPWADVRAVTHDNVVAFWQRPSPAEVETWGSYPLEADSETYAIAQPFTAAEVARAVREGRPRFRRRGSWPVGTRMQSPAYLRMPQLAAQKGRTALNKARRAYGFWDARRSVSALGGAAPAPTRAPEERR